MRKLRLPRHWYSIFVLVILLTFTGEVFAQINHANFSSIDGYSNKGNDFINLTFKNNDGTYSVEKAKDFLSQLEIEKQFIVEQIYETTLIEEIELRIEGHKRAIKEAKEELIEEENEFAILYNKFLIPKINNLINEIERDPNCSEICDGIIDQFSLGYMSVFSPKIARSYMAQDIAAFHTIGHLYGFTFKRNDPKALPAINLTVGSNQEDISLCLNEEVSTDQFLNLNQLRKLESCNFDISKLDPAHSPLWNNNRLNQNSLKNHPFNESLFPDVDSELTFKKVRFSGLGSPKLTLGYIKNGQKQKIKVKFGFETQIDPVIAALGKMIGLNQDETLYRDQIKVRFESKEDFNTFNTQIFRKYGERSRNHIIKKEFIGEEVFVTFRSALFEANRPDTVKLSAIDQSGWDLLSRREFRGMMLWFAWVSLRDTRNGNWRVQLQKENGELIPKISQQDVGIGLMGSAAIDKNPLDILVNGLRRTHVNSFNPTILDWDNKKVRVIWNDGFKNNDTFSGTTYQDLKWMARKIARLTRKDIEYAFSLGKMNQHITNLFVEKIISRRNDFIDAFDLNHEFNHIPTLNLKEYNVPGIVKEGKIIVQSLPETNRNQLEISPWFFLSELVQASIPFQSIGNEFNALFGQKFGMSGGIYTGKIPKITDRVAEEVKYFAHPGINFEVTRSITPMRFQQFEDTSQMFYTKDNIIIELDVRAGLVAEWIKHLPLTLKASLKTLKFEFSHHQPAETLEDAIKMPFRIQNILRNLNSYIANDLKAGEIFSYSQGNGISFEANFDYKKVLRFGSEISYVNSSPIYYHRNHFGELEIYQDKRNTKSVSASIKAGIDADLFFLPLAGFETTWSWLSGESNLYRLYKKDQEVKYQNPRLANIADSFERKALDALIDGGLHDVLPLMKREYQMNYVQKTRSSHLFFLIWQKRLLSEYSHFEIFNEQNEKEEFLRYTRRKEEDAGSSALASAFGGYVLFDSNQEMLELQMDISKPEKFVLIQNIYDFKHTLSKKKLVNFIEELNHRYSRSQDENFFRSDVLPNEQIVDKYKKVLNHQRIFYYGDQFLERISKFTNSDFRKLKLQILRKISFNPKRASQTVHDKADFIIRYIKKIISTSQNHKFEEFSKYLTLLIQEMDIQKYGMNLINLIFQQNDYFMAGEIYGILESINVMTEKHTASFTRRYTGKSYGDYKRRPPMWKYMDSHPVFIDALPETLGLRLDRNVFGVLPKGDVFIR